MSNSTITLQNIVNLASTHIDLLPLAGVGGYTNEPALSLCNDTMSEILTSSNDWKWNSVEIGILVTARNKQDYVYAGASCFTLGTGLATGSSSTGAALAITNGVTVSGGVVTVTTLENHRFKAGDTVYITGVVMTIGDSTKYNSTFTDDGSSSTWSGGWVIASVPTSTTFTFTATTGQNDSDAGGAPGIYNYGWLASATMVEMNNTASPQNTIRIRAVKDLQPWSKVANPEAVSVYRDNQDGTLTIRLFYVPGNPVWGIKMLLQAKPPLKTALTDTWSPIPDHYSAMVRQAFLYRCYRYINSPRAEIEYQKLQVEIQKAQGADDAEASEIYVVPQEGSLIDNSWWYLGY